MDPAQGSRAENAISLILLMVQKSGKHQLRLVVYPIIYDGFHTCQVVSPISSINSIIWKYHTLRILTPPMETPDPPSDNPGV